MRRIVSTCVLSLLLPLTAAADPQGLSFRGGIGVSPVSSGVGTAVQASDVNRNVVREIQPSGFPWTIRELRADVSTTGMIEVRGQGLLVAGGDSIGTNANQKVFATLVCGATAPFTTHSTPDSGVALERDGDFRITAALTPAPPATCTKPVLLIRNLAGAWFAAGIPIAPRGAN